MARKKSNSGVGKAIVALVLALVAYFFLQRESPPQKTKPKSSQEKNTGSSENGSANRGKSSGGSSASPATGGFAFESSSGFGQPSSDKNCELIRHKAYTLCYAEQYEQPYWVAYQLTASNIRGTAERENDFRPDPAVSSGSAIPEDYRGSGYDRGHLAPAADFKRSVETMSESFFMSNMSPQAPDFNRGIWEKLESRVRTWARRDKMLYIVTGPVLKRGLPTIGRRNQVAVPKQYYKIILYLKNPDAKAIGFLLPNEGSEKPLKSFAVPIDKLEKITGLDFFPQLPDQLENTLESTVDAHYWFSR